jgi:CBS domain containing-hemolysin-like protein
MRCVVQACSPLAGTGLLAPAALERLQIRRIPGSRFHTIAGFALHQLGHLPDVGEHFTYGNWTFEVLDLDGRRIDKLLATPTDRPAMARKSEGP